MGGAIKRKKKSLEEGRFLSFSKAIRRLVRVCVFKLLFFKYPPRPLLLPASFAKRNKKIIAFSRYAVKVAAASRVPRLPAVLSRVVEKRCVALPFSSSSSSSLRPS